MSDLILLKEKQMAPADILVLDTGTRKMDRKIFKVKQDAQASDQNILRYAMTNFFQGSDDPKSQVSNMKKI